MRPLPTTLPIALAATLLAAGSALAQGRTVDRTFQVGAEARIEVHNPFGDVHVRAWDRPVARVQANVAGGADPRIEGGRGYVNVHVDGRPRRESPIDYTIDVPARADVAVHTVEGDVTVEGTTGRIEAHSVRGDIRVRGGGGTVSLQSVQGTVSVDGTRGRVEVQAVNDDVVLRDVKGDVNVQVVNGGIRMSGIDATSVESQSVNGKIHWTGSFRRDGWYRFNSHNGEIELVVPRGAGAVVKVSTFNGTLRSDFPVTFQEGEQGKRFTFTLGSGGARVELETFNGSVHLRRP